MLLIARAELASHPLFKTIGLEPLGNELDGAALATRFAGKTTSLKAALLDQSLIAGLGKHLCLRGASSRRPIAAPRRQQSRAQGWDPSERAHVLAQVIREVLEEAVAAGGSSLRDHRQTNGALGYFQHSFRVYDREGFACQSPAAAERSNGSFNPAARPSFADRAKDRTPP